ncbi:hypothetical protein ABH920_000431 [Catenulispora sp. EB89]|uniref:hypothetical protein n=1 Tax=Catenulispora sp. EB89 TaxID=3156257 RepID=UPI003511E79D
MTSEDSFRERLESELAGLRPPAIGGIAGEALAHGRRIRRRERVVGVAGGVAAVAGVTAGAVALGGGFGPGGEGPGVGPGVAVGTTTHAPVPTPTPASSTSSTPSTSSSSSTSSPTSVHSSPGSPPSYLGEPSNTQSPPNTVIGTIPASWKPPVPVSPADPTAADGPSVAELVIEALQRFGPGTGSSFSGSSISGVNANATLTWTTQHGAIQISASVSNGALDGKSPQSQCVPAFEEDYCAAATLSDGSVVMVQHGTGYPSGTSAPTRNNMVSITRPDHAAINVVEWSDGPLTDDQLYQIVSDPHWGLRMAGSFVGHADAVVRPFTDDGAGG